jgi:protein-L-isoaspartate(D-aspartate) O-methyltransferase
MEREDLMNRLEHETQVFKNPAVKQAFADVDRKDFVEPDYEIEAYEDYAVPTLGGQDLPQPTSVAFMLELLDVRKGDVVLEIGSGTGWMTALLASMVGDDGKIFGLELIPELVVQSKKYLKKYKDFDIEIKQAGKEVGLYEEAPFDRIISTAEFPDKETVLAELMLQLAPTGIMIIPIEGSIWKFERVDDEQFYETEYPGFGFAPYVVGGVS